jgi:hypothetical protein
MRINIFGLKIIRAGWKLHEWKIRHPWFDRLMASLPHKVKVIIASILRSLFHFWFFIKSKLNIEQTETIDYFFFYAGLCENCAGIVVKTINRGKVIDDGKVVIKLETIDNLYCPHCIQKVSGYMIFKNTEKMRKHDEALIKRARDKRLRNMAMAVKRQFKETA